jgi:Recombination endonuclease VII
LAKYEALLESQAGVCAICGRPPKPKAPLHVDHDHETGDPRGLLCVRCNNALGLLDERPEVLYLAADYLDGAPWSRSQEIAGLAREGALALPGSTA